MTDMSAPRPSGAHTPVPRRSSARRRAPGGSARAGDHKATGRARYRRNRLLGWSAVGAVAAVVVALIGVKAVSGGGQAGAPRSAAPAALVSRVTSVPIQTLAAAAAKVNGLQPAVAANDQGLVTAGKPDVLYIGAEFCPVCAAERWPMVVALSQFGTFSGLQQTHSAAADGDIATVSFYGSTFSSPYLTFSPVETTTNQRSGQSYVKLQTPTPAQQALWTAHEGQQLSYPFVDIGGKWVLETSQYPTTVLAGRSFADIASAIGSNDNTIGASIDAAAARLVGYLCSVTGNQPARVCSAIGG